MWELEGVSMDVATCVWGGVVVCDMVGVSVVVSDDICVGSAV